MQVCQRCWFSNVQAGHSLTQLSAKPRKFECKVVPCGLFRSRTPVPGHAPLADPDGCGLVLEGTLVADVIPGGMASRWSEIRVGDELLQIAQREYKPGTPLAAYFADTEDATLCVVRRAVKTRAHRLSERPPRFASEAAARQGLRDAGDFHKGLLGKLPGDVRRWGSKRACDARCGA